MRRGKNAIDEARLIKPKWLAKEMKLKILNLAKCYGLLLM